MGVCIRVLLGIIVLFSIEHLYAEEVAQEPQAQSELVRVAVSPILYQLVRDATDTIKAESNISSKLTKAPASGVIMGVGEGLVELGFTTRAVTAEERAAHPQVELREVYIGQQILVMAVSRDVWDGGIKSLSAEEARRIYERRVTNWKELGGPDLKISFFTSDEGRGVWELFAEWLYQNTQRAPLGRFPVMKSHEEARNAIEFSPGSISILSPAFVTPPASNALGVKMEDGEVITPTAENVIAGKYPIKRSIYVLVNERPVGDSRELFHFFETPAGRKLLEKHGCVPAKAE